MILRLARTPLVVSLITFALLVSQLAVAVDLPEGRTAYRLTTSYYEFHKTPWYKDPAFPRLPDGPREEDPYKAQDAAVLSAPVANEEGLITCPGRKELHYSVDNPTKGALELPFVVSVFQDPKKGFALVQRMIAPGKGEIHFSTSDRVGVPGFPVGIKLGTHSHFLETVMHEDGRKDRIDIAADDEGSVFNCKTKHVRVPYTLKADKTPAYGKIEIEKLLDGSDYVDSFEWNPFTTAEDGDNWEFMDESKNHMGALIAQRVGGRIVIGFEHRLTGNGKSGDDGDFEVREGYRIFRADYDPRAKHIVFQSLIEAYESKPGALLVRGIVVDCIAKPPVRELKPGERITLLK